MYSYVKFPSLAVNVFTRGLKISATLFVSLVLIFFASNFHK